MAVCPQFLNSSGEENEKNYHYVDLDGNYHSEQVVPSYLPHIPLLLLR